MLLRKARSSPNLFIHEVSECTWTVPRKDEPRSDHFEKSLDMFRGRNNMGIMWLVYIRNDNYWPTKLKESIKSGEVDVPGVIPPFYSAVLKVSYVCRIDLNDKFER
jgi:hypothetical protein